MKLLRKSLTISSLCFAALAAPIASADVIASAPDHYTLKQEAVSKLSPEALWDRLITPSVWWHHSYSGNSDNFTLDVRAGGLWLEKWDDAKGRGEVEHGRILYVKHGEQMRLDAPFGPLQEMAVTVIWTITVEPHEEGSKVIFDEVASGSSLSGLDKIAPGVDYVKTEGIMRLADPKLTEKE